MPEEIASSVTPQSVDSVTQGGAVPAQAIPAPEANMRRMRTLLLLIGSTAYGLYVLWAIILMVLLPSADPASQGLVNMGVAGTAIAALVFLVGGSAAVLRVLRAPSVPDTVRMKGLIRVALVAVPGLLLSIAVPFLITREPALPIEVISPVNAEDLVAPLSVTFSVESAANLLRERGSQPVSYSWDFNGDRIIDTETVQPTAMSLFERQGVYAVSVRITMADKSQKTASRRLIIPSAVFSVIPFPPVVDTPSALSVAHLLSDPKLLKEVQWDFDGDGTVDKVTTEQDVSYTFRRKGETSVSAVVLLTNQSQTRYDRTLAVGEAVPPPFPVKIVTEPKHLVSPPPFGAIFRVETEEDLREVRWVFADGGEGEGERVAHTFQKTGIFPVRAQIISGSGEIADLSIVVRVVQELSLSDLTFDGSPQVEGKTISGEVPLTVSLKPRTSTPLVEFFWEAPEATEVGSTENSLQAVYRRQGTYTLTLVAQDPEGRALRYPITVEVKAPASAVSIRMDPEGGNAPLSVSFDASDTFIPGETISGFEWSFGDKSGPQFAGARTKHTFSQPGTYVVELKVRTISGKELKGSQTIVVQAPLLKACILPSRTSGSAPLGVQFSSECSVGSPASLLWDFGDGAQSNIAEPVHVFTGTGSFTVELTIQDAAGATSSTTVIITTTP